MQVQMIGRYDESSCMKTVSGNKTDNILTDNDRTLTANEYSSRH